LLAEAPAQLSRFALGPEDNRPDHACTKASSQF
jgi:hypothetical protein